MSVGTGTIGNPDAKCSCAFKWEGAPLNQWVQQTQCTTPNMKAVAPKQNWTSGPTTVELPCEANTGGGDGLSFEIVPDPAERGPEQLEQQATETLKKLKRLLQESGGEMEEVFERIFGNVMRGED